MNRRSNARGANNTQQRVQQQYQQHFVSSNGNQQQQQPQQQQQQQQEQTPQKPAQPQPQQTPQQQQPPQKEQQPTQPLQQPKTEPMDPAPVENVEMVESGDENAAEGGIGAKMRKIFAHRKNLSPADRKKLEKERKARQLRRLRKLLTPKNAVVALHELQGPGMSEFVINTNGQETTAEIVVNNVRYEATAPNKHLAKARASEKALRDLVIAQMSKAKVAEPKPTNGNSEANDNAASDDVDMAEVTDNDDVPMLHLASYALYKLFNEWQNEGFEIPAIKPAKAPVKLTPAGVHPLAPKVPKTKADLPADAATRHPTALLAFMRPQVPYEDLGSNNTNNHAEREFSVGVTVDGERFIGKARSKKMARKEAAAAACQKLFEVEFDQTAAA